MALSHPSGTLRTAAPLLFVVRLAGSPASFVRSSFREVAPVRPRWSLRSIFALVTLAVVLAGGARWAAGGAASVVPSSPAPAAVRPTVVPAVPVVSVEEAVRRTLAAGSAELALTVGAAGRPPGEVAGTVSRVSPDAVVTASMPGVGEAEVRVRGGEAWLRTDRAPWQRIEPAALALTGAVRGWGDLLTGLRPMAVSARGQPLRATSAGRPAQLWVDHRGRITRLVVEEGPATLDLRLRGHGVDVEVDPPP